jgi:ABC-type transporter Mla subunit MlaD
MPRRSGRQQSAEELTDQLLAMTDQLIAENRELKKQVARLQAATGGFDGNTRSTLNRLQRRLQSALTSDRPSPRKRRRITDPEVLEKRRAALAKARATLAEKRAAGNS